MKMNNIKTDWDKLDKSTKKFLIIKIESQLYPKKLNV